MHHARRFVPEKRFTWYKMLNPWYKTLNPWYKMLTPVFPDGKTMRLDKYILAYPCLTETSPQC